MSESPCEVAMFAPEFDWTDWFSIAELPGRYIVSLSPLKQMTCSLGEVKSILRRSGRLNDTFPLIVCFPAFMSTLASYVLSDA